MIIQNQINDDDLKTYVETRWTNIYECISLIVQLKTCLKEIQENHSKIISLTILTILHDQEQLHHIHTTEVSPKIIANIAESVFKELKEKTLLDDDNIKLSNSSEELYPDEPNLNLKISNIIEDKESEYNVDEIV
ncbi:21155_t:CDS:2, partial [Cetraspora pellucida]